MAGMSIKLTTTSYIVLGLVARRESCTPYDLKRADYQAVEYFWTIPHSQLYAEPERLKKAGLLQETRERNGRRRRLFRITDAGREALTAWLKEPTAGATEIRDLGLLKLYFGELSTANDVATLAREQEQLHRQRLAEYQAIGDARRGDEAPGYRLAILEMGLLFERAAIAFWSSMAAPQVDRLAKPVEEEGSASTATQLPEHLL